MAGESKGKIQIKPKSTGTPNKYPNKGGAPGNKGDDIREEIKKLKKQVGRLLNIAEHEENIVEKYRDQEMVLKLVDGSEEKGILKEITKFQIVLDQDGIENHFYKSAIIKYRF